MHAASSAPYEIVFTDFGFTAFQGYARAARERREATFVPGGSLLRRRGNAKRFDHLRVFLPDRVSGVGSSDRLPSCATAFVLAVLLASDAALFTHLVCGLALAMNDWTTKRIELDVSLFDRMRTGRPVAPDSPATSLQRKGSLSDPLDPFLASGHMLLSGWDISDLTGVLCLPIVRR